MQSNVGSILAIATRIITKEAFSSADSEEEAPCFRNTWSEEHERSPRAVQSRPVKEHARALRLHESCRRIFQREGEQGRDAIGAWNRHFENGMFLSTSLLSKPEITI